MACEQVTLQDVCELIVDCPHTSAKDEGVGYPLIRTPNVGRGRLILTDVHRVSQDVYERRVSRAVPRQGDLILAREAPAGNVAIVSPGIEVCLGQRTMLLRPDSSFVVPEYLNYYLNAPEQRDRMLRLANGATVSHINVADIRNMPVQLPSCGEQSKVAELLNVLDDKIDLNNRLNDYLLELATSLFDERIKDSFEYTTVREYVKYMSNGSTPSRKNSSYWDDGTIPWIKTGEVNNKLIFDTSEHITKHALEKTSVHLLPKDTVIMALYGSGTAGRLALLQSPATTNQACTAMICESSSEAFYLFVVLKKMYHEIDNLTRGSVQQNLSKEIVANLRVPNVKKDILDSLGFNVIYSQIAFSEAETLNLTKLRDALLPRLMSGEIDVSKVDLTQLTNNHLADC